MPGPAPPATRRGCAGCHSSSRWESRKRSVASIEIDEPEISMRTPVSTGSMSSRPAAVTAWAHGVGEHVAGDRAGRGRHVGQRGVVLDRHRLQAEARRAAGQADPRAVERHLDRLGRQAAADVGEQPAADQGLALVGRPRRTGWRGPRSRSRRWTGPGRRRSPRSAGRTGRGRSDGREGCAPPRRRHPRVRRGRRETSLHGSFVGREGGRSGRSGGFWSEHPATRRPPRGRAARFVGGHPQVGRCAGAVE